MIIPAFVNVQFTEEDGFLTPQMQLYNDELNTVLRNGLSDNGWTLPTVTQAQLADIIAFALPTNQPMPNGTIWYVHDDDTLVYEVVVLINGALRKVTTSAYP
jgi:hypothetical protein